MHRAILFLALGLIGCPTPVEESPTAAAPTAAAPAPAPGGKAGPPGPPPVVPKGGDQLQREIGALNKKGLALKASVTRYLEKNTSGGMLSLDDGFGGTDTLGWVRYHDPVREKPGKGYLVLSDFKKVDAEPGAFHVVAFWLKDMPTGYRVTEAIVQAHPVKRDGQWVRLDHFEINDEIAPPLK